MCPDNSAPDSAPPTDPFRATIAPAEGPNTTGYDDLVRHAHHVADATSAPDDLTEEG